MGVTFNVAQTGFKIRAATAEDFKACRMLLPPIGEARQLVVAIDAAQNLIIGAAAATRARREKSPVGPGMALHVIPPCRQVGVGRALLVELVRGARDAGDEAIYLSQRIDEAGDDFSAWRALGFEVVETVEYHDLPVAGFAPRLAPIVEWLRRHDRIPADACIVPLYAADREGVLQLHLRHLGGDRDALQARLRGSAPDAFHPRYSRVLTVGDRIAGCVLAHRTSLTVAEVDAVIVAPDLRNDWANAWLKLEACRGAEAIGITHFHFASFDHYQDTRLFTSQLGGVTTRKQALMALRIEKTDATRR
ncbi:MAG: hypothetical protein KDA44_12980 [Planctomycetales bacterium]|nr:hypothetical protein [Planctomycetales bacterium]